MYICAWLIQISRLSRVDTFRTSSCILLLPDFPASKAEEHFATRLRCSLPVSSWRPNEDFATLYGDIVSDLEFVESLSLGNPWSARRLDGATEKFRVLRLVSIGSRLSWSSVSEPSGVVSRLITLMTGTAAWFLVRSSPIGWSKVLSDVWCWNLAF